MTTRPRRGARGSDRGMMYSGWKLARDFVSRHRFALSFRDVPRSPTMNSAAARQMTLVALLLATVLGLFVAAELGHRKLEEVRRQVETGAQREQALAEVLQLLSQADSSQRGSILLGDCRIPRALPGSGRQNPSVAAPARAGVRERRRAATRGPRAGRATEQRQAGGDGRDAESLPPTRAQCSP